MALTLLGLSIFQPLDDNGAIMPAGKVYFYETGTVNAKDVFHDADGLNPWTQPVELDAAGRAVIFLDDDGAYDIVLTDANDVEIWTLTKVLAAMPVV
jgi:hypothetical protein